MSSQETTPIPVDKQQLVTCGRGPNFQHRGHLCKSRDLNASHFLSLNRKRPFFSYTNVSPTNKSGNSTQESHETDHILFFLRGYTLGEFVWGSTSCKYLFIFFSVKVLKVEGTNMSWVPRCGFHQMCETLATGTLRTLNT